jgi:hypothetical protein
VYIALLIDAGPAYLPGGKFLLKSRNPLQMPPALAPFSAPILALKERERERERKKERKRETSKSNPTKSSGLVEETESQPCGLQLPCRWWLKSRDRLRF